MTLSAGTRLGPYDIFAPRGAGGPNVLAIYDFGNQDGVAYAVTEHSGGHPHGYADGHAHLN
jgi:hypothetical protein